MTDKDLENRLDGEGGNSLGAKKDAKTERLFKSFFDKQYESSATWGNHWTYQLDDCDITKTGKREKIIAYIPEEHEWCEDGGGIAMRPAIAIARIRNGQIKKVVQTKYFPARDQDNSYEDDFSVWYQRIRILKADKYKVKARAYATREDGYVTDFTFDLKKGKLLKKRDIGFYSDSKKYEEELKYKAG